MEERQNAIPDYLRHSFQTAMAAASLRHRHVYFGTLAGPPWIYIDIRRLDCESLHQSRKRHFLRGRSRSIRSMSTVRNGKICQGIYIRKQLIVRGGMVQNIGATILAVEILANENFANAPQVQADPRILKGAIYAGKSSVKYIQHRAGLRLYRSRDCKQYWRTCNASILLGGLTVESDIIAEGCVVSVLAPIHSFVLM